MKPTVVIVSAPQCDSHFLICARHRVGRDAVALMQRRKRAGVKELVGQADLPERRRHAGAQQQARHRLAEAADDGVVLGHDHHPARARRLPEDRRLIQRLDGRHVQHADIDAVGFQRLDGFERPHGHEAGRDDERILAVAQELRFAEFERVVVLVEDQGHVAAQQAHVHRAGMGGDGGHDLLDLVRVARVDDGHVRQAAEDREVLGRLVARPVAGGEPRQGADDLHVEVLFGDRHADEVVGPPRREHRVGGGPGLEALARHAGGGADQKLLRHAHLVEAVGMGLREDVQVGVFAEVRREADDLGPGLGKSRERITERSGLGALPRRRRARRSSPRW